MPDITELLKLKLIFSAKRSQFVFINLIGIDSMGQAFVVSKDVISIAISSKTVLENENLSLVF